MAEVTHEFRGHLIKNVRAALRATHTVKETSLGALIVPGVEAADKFAYGHLPEINKVVYDAEKTLTEANRKHSLYDRSKEFTFAFRHEVPGELAAEDGVRFEITTSGSIAYPRGRYLSSSDYKTIHTLEPALMDVALRTAMEWKLQRDRDKFVLEFLHNFVPPALEAHQKKTMDYGYIPPSLRGRNTLAKIAKDWPLLIRLFPDKFRGKLGSRSYSTKNQTLNKQERFWLPYINELLSSGLIIGLDHTPAAHKASPKGVFLSL